MRRADTLRDQVPVSAQPRELGAVDVDALLDLQRDCFGVEAWTRNMVVEELTRPGGILIGFGEPLFAFACGWIAANELHLLQIATLPSHRNRGWAALLLTEVMRRSRSHVDIGWLEVRHDNATALRFYLRHEWEQIGIRRRYYADGADALVLRWKPKPSGS